MKLHSVQLLITEISSIENIWMMWNEMTKKDAMYHKISNNHDRHVENETWGFPSHLHTVPHGLYPFSTKHSEHNEEWMEEVIHVPPRKSAVFRDFTHTILIVFSKQLHAHNSKDENNDG